MPSTGSSSSPTACPSPQASAACRQGGFAAVDPTLEELLGRPPQTVREVQAKG